MNNYSYHVASPNVLAVRTNQPDLKWSFGVNIPATTRDQFEACPVRIEYNIDDSVPAPAPEFGKYHYFGGLNGADELRYDRTFLGKRRLRFSLRNLADGVPSLTVNSDYARFITHRFMNLHSPGYILTDIIGLQLLRNGFAPVHCAAFRYKGATVLILAAPNTGKTLTSMMACIENGAEFLAEDLAITDGKDLYSVPWTSTFRYYDRIDQSRRSRIWGRLTNVMPPLELIPATKTKSVDTLIPSSRILDRSEVTHVVVLERGEEGLQVPDLAEVTRKAINLNRYEFAYAKSPSLVAYEFFNPSIDLGGAVAKEHDMLTQLMSNASETLVAQSMDATRYAPMILEHLDRQ